MYLYGLCVSLQQSCKGLSRAYKLWGDLRPRGQSLDQKFLLQHCINQVLVSFIAKILLNPYSKHQRNVVP